MGSGGVHRGDMEIWEKMGAVSPLLSAPRAQSSSQGNQEVWEITVWKYFRRKQPIRAITTMNREDSYWYRYIQRQPFPGGCRGSVPYNELVRTVIWIRSTFSVRPFLTAMHRATGISHRWWTHHPGPPWSLPDATNPLNASCSIGNWTACVLLLFNPWALLPGC